MQSLSGMENIMHGTQDILPAGALAETLGVAEREGRPLRIKLGMDPTAPDLHLGHAVLLQKARQLQDLGHEVLFVIGDFTAMIGDPTGKSATRPPLTAGEVQANAQTYRDQIFRILDPQRTRVVFNSEWLGALSPQELIRMAACYTVARMLERDDFQKRYRGGHSIAIHEFLYPLLQGYDSVALHADMELGGTDQRFNLLVGRDLQKEYGQRQQMVLTMPILEGLDGVQKMSKSLGNYIALADQPKDMFGKIMSISDTLMWRYYALLSRLPAAGQKRLREEADTGRVNPMDCKLQLAEELVDRFHGAGKGRAAREGFQAQVQRREQPQDLPLQEVVVEGVAGLARVLVVLGWVGSTSEAMRKIGEGAVRIGGERAQDPHQSLNFAHEYHLQYGKRHFARVVLRGQAPGEGHV